VHGVAGVGAGSIVVGPDGLDGAGDGVVGDVGGTEVVHVGGVRPVSGDGSVAVEHALVRAGHSVGGGSGHHVVDEVVLVHVGGGDGGGTESHGRADAARVGAHAGGELLEVVDGLEHCCKTERRVVSEDAHCT
jgi:hypothetical protein